MNKVKHSLSRYFLVIFCVVCPWFSMHGQPIDVLKVDLGVNVSAMAFLEEFEDLARFTGGFPKIVEDNLSVIRYRGSNGLLVNLRFSELPNGERLRILRLRKKGRLKPEHLTRYGVRSKARPLIVNKDGVRLRGKVEDAELSDAIVNATVLGYEKISGLTTVMLSTGSKFWTSQYRDSSGLTDSFWPEILVRLEEQFPGDRIKQDPFLACIEHMKASGKEIFWTVRVNDTHDVKMKVEELRGWKGANALTEDAQGDPFLVGTQRHPPKYTRPNALNYANDLVRAHFLAIIENGIQYFAGHHRLDGIEIDFMRHMVLFESVASGKQATDSERALITEMMLQIRAKLDAVARDRGSPILLYIRVPDSPEFCRRIGVDLERWLSMGLVDGVVSGDYFLLSPLEDFSTFCHKYNVPYFPCFERRRIELDVEGKTNSASMSVPVEAELWRGEALNAWDAGVDGIYIFNRPSVGAKVLKMHLVEPEKLRMLNPDLIRRQTKMDSSTKWARPELWLSGWK